MSTEVSTTKAMTLAGRINACHRECRKSGEEMLRYAVECGELLTDVKALLKADKTTTFEKWGGQFLDFSWRTAESYCKLYKDLRRLPKAQQLQVFDEVDSIRGLQKRIAEAAPKDDPAPAPAATPPPPAPVLLDRDGDPLPDPPEVVDEPEVPAATETPKPGIKALTGAEAEAFDARQMIGGMHKTLSNWLGSGTTIDMLRAKYPGKHGDAALEGVKAAYEALRKWEKVIK